MSASLPRTSALLGACVLLGAAACARQPLLENPNLDRLGALAQEVDGAALMATVNGLVQDHGADTPLACTDEQSRLYTPLCHLTHDKARARIEAQLAGRGLTVTHQELVARTGLPLSNVIAELPGASHPEEIVLVGAHYDAFYAGADDNSTGVAAVLELARVLSQHRFDRTLRFVAFDQEELGGIGSDAYVDETRGEHLVNAVIYDCIGYYDTRPGSQTSLPGLPTPSAADFIAGISNDTSSQRLAELNALNDALQLAHLVTLTTPRSSTFPLGSALLRSDHSPFWFSGQEALFLTDTANFRNPHYHQDTDTVDTLDPARYTQVVRLSAAGLAYWAGGPL